VCGLTVFSWRSCVPCCLLVLRSLLTSSRCCVRWSHVCACLCKICDPRSFARLASPLRELSSCWFIFRFLTFDAVGKMWGQVITICRMISLYEATITVGLLANWRIVASSFGKCCFNVCGPSIWNQIPSHIYSASAFCRALKLCLFPQLWTLTCTSVYTEHCNIYSYDLCHCGLHCHAWFRAVYIKFTPNAFHIRGP